MGTMTVNAVKTTMWTRTTAARWHPCPDPVMQGGIPRPPQGLTEATGAPGKEQDADQTEPSALQETCHRAAGELGRFINHGADEPDPAFREPTGSGQKTLETQQASQDGLNCADLSVADLAALSLPNRSPPKTPSSFPAAASHGWIGMVDSISRHGRMPCHPTPVPMPSAPSPAAPAALAPPALFPCCSQNPVPLPDREPVLQQQLSAQILQREQVAPLASLRRHNTPACSIT